MVFSCEDTTAFGKHWLRFGFEACSRDCTGASLTDALLAAHALWWAFSIRKLHGGEFQRNVLRCLLANSAWSATGALVWLQPGGRRDGLFELLFRFNGFCQALLICAWWHLFNGVLCGTRCRLSTRGQGLLSLLAVVHALAFAWRTFQAPFEAYVLCGGANVTPPLSSLWLCICWLCYRHRLWTRWRSGEPGTPPHPLLLGASAGLLFWAGNSAIFSGADRGVSLWMRQLLAKAIGDTLPPQAFEEMASFHLFGVIGNEFLFRAYAWLALAESRILRERMDDGSKTRASVDGAVDGAAAQPLWLEAALKLSSA